MSARAAFVALAVAAVFPFVLACGGGSAVKTTDIVSTVPWPQTESLTYVLKDKSSGKVVGNEVLSIAQDGTNTALSQRFSGATSDETSVIVDPKTLKPISGRRVIVSGSDRQELETTYSNGDVLIKEGAKQSGLKVPDNSYDNDTSLFLWRTLDFQNGYSAAYNTIITNQRSRQTVQLSVTSPENVSVQAGQFQAWHVTIKTENAKQSAWYADTPTRPLVKYDNGSLIFELESQLPAQ